MSSKIISLDESLHLEGCVLCYGHFTTIHAGHIRYLRHAKMQGEKLAIALKGDGNNLSEPKYRFKRQERAEALALLNIADFIILLEDDELVNVVNRLNPSLLVLGKQFELQPEEQVTRSIEILEKKGHSVLFHDGDIQYATTVLLSESEQDLRLQRQREFKSACKRQMLTLRGLLQSMDAWKSANLIVLGDTIVDQYAACEAIGMSAEAPVVVVRELKKKNFLGGAAIVASHIRSLGAKCNLISVVGDDDNAKIVNDGLLLLGIDNGIVVDPSRPTTFKKRYLVENQKLFRVTRLEENNLDINIENKIIENLQRFAKTADGIVVSDFVYGVVTDRILEIIHELANKYNLMLFGDLQCSSQIGSVTRFKDFSLLCPNEKEARIALQDKESGLELISQDLLSQTSAQRLIMKLGSDGFIAYDRSNSDELFSQPFPALSVNPVDVAGAGDSLLAVMATGLSCRQPMMTTASIGCCMAALAVEQMGNSPITIETLKENIVEILT